MKIPIIIINWNGYKDTLDCIHSVLETEDVDFEIFLVDNGSDNNEGEQLQAYFHSFPNINYFFLDENIGFAKANNFVLQQILKGNYQWVILLNNDTVVDPKWLSGFIRTARLMKADMVSAKFIQYYDRDLIDNLGHQMLNTGEVIPIAHDEPTSGYDSSFYNFGSCAGAALYSVPMLREVGTFDPFFSTGYEDAELGVRAVVAGYKAVYSPDSLVYHKGGQSIRKVFNEDYALMIQSAIWYTYFKLMPMTVILVSVPFIVVKTITLSLINLLFSRWKYLRIRKKFYHFSMTIRQKMDSPSVKFFVYRNHQIS